MELLLLFSCWTVVNSLPPPEIVWECRLPAPLKGIPVFYPNVTEPEGVLTWIEDGVLVFIDSNGCILWQKQFSDKGDSPPAIGDIDGDGTNEIVCVGAGGTVSVLTKEGSMLWEYPLGFLVKDWEAPAIADVNGDGALEILIGTMEGWMVCLTKEGRMFWRFKVDEQKASSPAFVPLPFLSGGYVIYGTENDHVVAVTPGGELAWLSRHEGQYGRTSPTAGDLTGNGKYEVILHTSYNNPKSRILALDAFTGELVWEAPLNLHGYASNAIADVDGDGKNEAIVALRSNTIYCFSGDGKERWHTITGGHAYFYSPAVADINGDGECEIIGGVRDTNERGNSWFVLSNCGKILGEYSIPGGCPATPLVADINKDGKIEIILPGTKAGLIRCVTFNGKTDGASLQWVSHRYDAARTGCVPIQNLTYPTGQKNLIQTKNKSGVEFNVPILWGRNEFSLKGDFSEFSSLVVECNVVSPYGYTVTRVWDTFGEPLPNSFPIDLVGKGKFLIKVRAYEIGKYKNPLLYVEKYVQLESFDKFNRNTIKELSRLEKIANILPTSAQHMSQLLIQQKDQLEGELASLRRIAQEIDFAHVPDTDKFLSRLNTFRSHLQLTFALASLIEKVSNQNPYAVIVIWQDENPWDDTPPLLESSASFNENSFCIEMYKNEYESMALNVINLLPEPVTIQLRPDKVALENILFYEVLEVPRSDGFWVSDALAELNSASTMTLIPGKPRKIWLTVSGKKLPSGTTKLSCRLLPLGYEHAQISFTVEARVDSLDLATAPKFYVCNWSSPQRAVYDEIDPKAIQVAREHGTNVFTMGMPARRADEHGNLVGEVDWSSLDEAITQLGEEDIILLSGEPVEIPAHIERFGEVHVQAERKRLRELAQHLNSLGWGFERWALYPVDEPGLFGGTRIRMFEQIASHFKRALPEVQVYANPSGFVTPENMRNMIALTDIWQPEQGLLRRQPDLASFFLNTGKPVWCYEAPGDVKRLRPLGYYRANPWMAFQLGLSGTGFWTQFYIGQKEEDNDLWLRQANNEWGANYVNAGKETISRRWEAFRDGIEDVRAFLLLQEATKLASEKGIHNEVLKRVEKVLHVEVKEATRKAWVCNDITRFLRDYELDFERVKQIRKEVAKLTHELLTE